MKNLLKMEESYAESDVTLSPSQILERLQVLRQLQLLQRGKLQKQRLEYKETSETSSSITEIVSHFSNSTSYNTFRSLLQSSHETSNGGTPRFNTSDMSPKVKTHDLIEGVSVLNLSQESEFIVNSPVSSRSRTSVPSQSQNVKNQQVTPQSACSENPPSSNSASKRNPNTKQIALDDMPILSPKTDFETLLLEKLQKDKTATKTKTQDILTDTIKKPFLKKGEGVARFGLKKTDFKIQNTKSLPWRRKSFDNKLPESPLKLNVKQLKEKQKVKRNVEARSPAKLDIDQVKLVRKQVANTNSDKKEQKNSEKEKDVPPSKQENNINSPITQLSNIMNQKVPFPKTNHPLQANKGKTCAAVLTKEQNDFLQQLKQSDYYKNYGSPTKSCISDISCNEQLSRLRVERETAEQNMFDLLENKVCHESFNLNSSFLNRFLRRSNLEYTGESTPIVMQKCLSENPELRHLYPEINIMTNNSTQDGIETSCSNYTDCCSETCSSVSCCSCKTVEESTPKPKKNVSLKRNADKNKKVTNQKEVVTQQNQDDTMTDNDTMKANMAEMNAKLIATSELLKDRLKELEDEIETFRKENSILAKLREEVDLDRQKFYEERASFEQKFNEEKILAEYYLAEEKEKLTKQKQMYERYVREMRGRLNKKDKDEVVNLKKEISDLKEEIRIKDAKSTSTIARLRNQIKIMEKEKKDLQEAIEKLKKQNRRIQHSNEVTRRLTNIKYLEEINKKLTNMATKDTQSEVRVDRDAKYKSYEIERQSRSRRLEPLGKVAPRQRAKSVPNLNVTSRYAKYFSQRDVISHMEQNNINIEGINITDDEENSEAGHSTNSDSSVNNDMVRNIEENHIEKIYLKQFRSTSPKSNRSSGSNYNIDDSLLEPQLNDNANGFFIQKSKLSSVRSSKSPKQTISSCFNTNEAINKSKSPVSILSNQPTKSSPLEFVSNQSSSNNSQNRVRSPHSTFDYSSLKSTTVIHNDQYEDKLLLSPEPSRTSKSLSKTSLNPTETKQPDGSRELRFPNGNVKYISADGKYSKFVYYNGDVKENFYNEGRIKYFYAETKTYHTTHADGLEVLEFPDGQIEKRYKDGSSEIRLPNGSVRYFDPKNVHVREEWRFPDGAALTVSADGEQRIVFSNGQVEVHAKDHKRREFPDGTVKLVYNDGTAETRYASGRVRIKDKHRNLIMDSAPS